VNGFQSFEQQARNATGGFATSIANMKSAVTRGITNVIDSINRGLERAGLPTIQTMITKVGSGIEKVLNRVGAVAGRVIQFLSPAVNLIKQVADFIGNNWTVIAPIIGGIITALGLYYGAQLMMNGINTIATGIEAAKTFALGVQVAALEFHEGATLKATAAQYGFNTALLACPITWIVLGIIAMIAVFIILWEKCEGFRDFISKSVAEIGKNFGWLYNNVIVPTANGAIDVINRLSESSKNMLTGMINRICRYGN